MSAFGRLAGLETRDWLARSRSFGPSGLAFALLQQSLSRFPKPLKSAGLSVFASLRRDRAEALGEGGETCGWLPRSRSVGPLGLAFASLKQSLSQLPKPLKSPVDARSI